MKTNWLWDVRTTEQEAIKILMDDTDPKFLSIAEKIISRCTLPKEVFKFLDKKIFCKNWIRIKKRMFKDVWMRDRITFWQIVYERVLERLKEKGFELRPQKKIKPKGIRKSIAEQIKHYRVGKGWTQKQLAKKLGVIQPYISRIEKGYENISLDSLQKLSKVFNCKLEVRLSG